MQEGEGLFVGGSEERVLGAGDIAVVPAGMPHRFENRGTGHFSRDRDPREPALPDGVARVRGLVEVDM